MTATTGRERGDEKTYARTATRQRDGHRRSDECHLPVAAGTYPQSVAVNPVTNMIYVANNSSSNVTVIDGATNTTTTVAAGSHPYSVTVNTVTNKIYVANNNSGNVTVIDGATNITTTVAAGSSSHSVAVNPVTNKIYVANYGSNNVTLIDGATNATTTVAAGSNPFSVAVNPVARRVYVANYTSNNVTVIDSLSPGYYTVTPCRFFDTRDAELGGPSPLGGGSTQAVPVLGKCAVPATAKAISINVTVTQPGAPGFLTLYPTDLARPTVSVINFSPSHTRANTSVVPLGPTGEIAVFSGLGSGSVHVIMDVNGYFE